MTLSNLQGAARYTMAALVFFALAPVADANAQPVAGNFEQLRAKVRNGETIYLTDDAGGEMKATVLGVSPSALSLAVDGSAREFGPDRVRTIRKRYNDPVWQGALIGAIVGISPGLAYCAGRSDGACSGTGGAFLSMGALGAGIGIGIDALIQGKKRIYEAGAGSSKTIAVAPVLSPNTKGLRVSFQF